VLNPAVDHNLNFPSWCPLAMYPEYSDTSRLLHIDRENIESSAYPF
jgi:hypothetical protein